MDDSDDQDFVSTEHDRLVSAITKLDKTQHINIPTRNESTNINSEFNLIKRSNKLDLNKAVKVLKDTAHHAKITKKLKGSQHKSKILPKPLEKPQAERIKRSAGYDETKEKITKWDAVVARNRTVDYVSFPLQSAIAVKEHPTKVILSNLRLKSNLEKELDEIDPPADNNEEEAEQSFPMTYEEMIEHRKQLAKLRAQQSYKAAKAKRQSKIKSKKYHRILKKERLKQQLKEFEELQFKNPEEALKKLEELEKARALERHTLRHKNTGKWAKNKLVRAKYDKEVRQQLAEQLSVSRGLTHKTQNQEISDDEAGDSETVSNVPLAQDPTNPWMMQNSNKSNIDEEFNFGYKKYLKVKMLRKPDGNHSDDENDEGQDESNFSALKESILKLGGRKLTSKIDKDNLDINNDTQIISSNRKKKFEKSKIVTATSQWIVDDVVQHNNKNTDISNVFDSLENEIVNKVEKKLNKLKADIVRLDRKPKQNNKKYTENQDHLESLTFKNKNQRPIIDEELIESNKKNITDIDLENKTLTSILQSGPEPTRPSDNIDPNTFIEVKPKYLNTALSQGENEFDDLEDEEQIVPKVDIEEVFEEDDVVASFRQEKQEEIDNDTPKEIDLSLPGWGQWGGKGVKAPKRKRNRFITKPAPKIPRRDENKGDIIINEMKMTQLANHKVSELPFPFTSVSDFEASIRLPIGNTFIPETAHKKLIRPNVITKAGTIIEPMDEEQLLVKRNQSFKNEDVIRLLAKK
ncbi:U3 small nucleolar RNA-associated protein 14 homolog A [Leptidea sinapis]|uniref:U3 small nucleolar RNA-associated protein 14 homolog A n=1 Tax=Leptidea sinapis TaxID=189913 RepID=UPI0021C2E873|nr:U3 small nucleolar RNA-associated protein 14 homolog A [Leptidea sinapis]